MASYAAVTFEVSPESLRRLRKVLSPSQLRSALFQAVKRTTKRGGRIAAKEIQTRTGLPRRYVDDPKHRRSAIRTVVSKGDVPVGRIIIRDVPLPLSAFKHTASKKNGVFVTIEKAEGPIHLIHAFTARVASKAQEDQGVSHVGIFNRERIGGRSAGYYTKRPSAHASVYSGQVTPEGFAWRLPIRERLGPPVQKLIGKSEIAAAVYKGIGNELEKQVNSQLSRFTKGQIVDVRDIDDTLEALADA